MKLRFIRTALRAEPALESFYPLRSSSSISRLLSSEAATSSLRPPDINVSVDLARPRSAATDVDVASDDLDLAGKATVTVNKTVIPTVLQPRVVIFDGVCHLCHRGVKWVIKADKYRKIKFCCLQSRAAEPYMKFCGVDREDVLQRFVFIEGLGEYHQASTAALKVLSYLPFPYSAMSGLLVIPTPVRDAVYDYVAKRRYDWFGKEDDCLVMNETELLDRFIDAEEILERKKHSEF